MMTTMSLAWTLPLFSWTALGYILLATGLVATLLSPYRYLLGYLFAGMAYWLAVDGIQSALLVMFSLNSWQGYIFALGITWLLLGVWFIYRLNKQAVKTSAGLTAAQDKALDKKYGDNYIEHTPIYKNYQPRFNNSKHSH